MKTIDTLVEDIYKILEKGVEDVDCGVYGEEHTTVLEQRLATHGEEGPQRLRLSSIGKPCVRQLWYGLHAHLHREPLRPATRLKFLYGDLIETLLLELARKSGHLVEGEQDEILVNGIKGHRDCIIDGMLVDVKSASSYSFAKFKDGLRSEDDAFGYLTQLGSYLLGSRNDDRVTYKNEAAFLVMDKVTGALCLDRHTFTEEDYVQLSDTIKTRREELAQGSPLPGRGFDSINQYKPNKKGWVNGNKKLDVNCSYCDFKAHCWPELRTFMYAGGKPVFLTHVEEVPNVPEIWE